MSTDRTSDDDRDRVPNEEEVAREFPAAENTSLREQTDLTDADGDDIRQYTGEPVETEHGTVVPQQMPSGAQELVGGGEFPNTPGRADEDGEDGGEEVDDR